MPMPGFIPDSSVATAAGDRAALDQALPLLYDDLRRLARRQLARERSARPVQPTTLVHEAWLKLAARVPHAVDHGHLLAIAAHAASRAIARALAAAVVTTLAGACAGEAPVAPRLATSTLAASAGPQRATSAVANEATVAATLRRVTDRYRDIETAKRDGFVLLHDCESRPGEGPVGTVCVHVGRLLDGKISVERPDALIYEPRREGRFTLVGAELAIPYAMAPNQQAPTLLGHTFQDEPEFGVYALHAWVWRDNPDGMFAETNPKVPCLN